MFSLRCSYLVINSFLVVVCHAVVSHELKVFRELLKSLVHSSVVLGFDGGEIHGLLDDLGIPRRDGISHRNRKYPETEEQECHLFCLILATLREITPPSSIHLLHDRQKVFN